MRRAFLTNLALLLVLNLLVKPFFILGIDAEVQVRAGTAAYGDYAALLSLSFLLNILLDLGITNYNTRNIAQHTHLLKKHLSGIIGVRLVLVVLYALATFATAMVLGYRADQLGLLAILVLNQVLVATVLYLRSNIAGAQLYTTDSLLSVLDRVLLIGLVGWLLWGRYAAEPFPIQAFVWAQTVAYATTALVALYIVVKRAGGLRIRWNGAFMWVVLRQSFPYALLILLMTFYYRTDTVMLERMLPDGALQAGIYAQGFRFFEAFNMLGYLFAGLLLPMFSRLIKQKDDLAPLTGLAFRLVLAGALAVAVAGSFHAQALMDLRYTEFTERSAPAFAVLIWCFTAVCTTYIFGTLLTASGDLKALNWMAACGMLLNIGLNLVLIPRYQALGAAWASLITQSLTALVQVLLAARKFRFAMPWGGLASAAAYAAGLLALAWWSRGMALGNALLVLGAGGAVLAFATRLLDVRMLRQAIALPRGR
ncbi:MAG: oligosaccharide flippase family protein [Flavobacteriales bacterium]|nr:oligosaccharide flippase family protein [Flavobacteriales bacterium]